MDTEKLTQGEDLILDVLIARRRLGENAWTFQARHNRVLNTLRNRGLVDYKSASVQGASLAWLTDEAEEEYITKVKYVPPLVTDYEEELALHEELARRGLLAAPSTVKKRDEKVLLGLQYRMLDLITHYYQKGITPGTIMRHFEDWDDAPFVRQAWWGLLFEGHLELHDGLIYPVKKN